MRTSKAERRYRLIENLKNLGFTYEEANQLRRIEMTLQRWAELECGDSSDYASVAIERDEETNKPYRVWMPHNLPPSQATRTLIPDRERGALDRLTKIVNARNSRVCLESVGKAEPVSGGQVEWYHQTDPRGCALYIVRKSDLNGQDINSVYTRGLAVCD